MEAVAAVAAEPAMLLEAETPAAMSLAAEAAAEVETEVETAMPLEAETPAAMSLAAEAAAEVETGIEMLAAMMLLLETVLVPSAGAGIAKLLEPEAGTAIPLRIVAAAPQTLLQLLDLYIFHFHLNQCTPFPKNNELNILSFYAQEYLNLD